jgi:hypothetical protein
MKSGDFGGEAGFGGDASRRRPTIVKPADEDTETARNFSRLLLSCCVTGRKRALAFEAGKLGVNPTEARIAVIGRSGEGVESTSSDTRNALGDTVGADAAQTPGRFMLDNGVEPGLVFTELSAGASFMGEGDTAPDILVGPLEILVLGMTDCKILIRISNRIPIDCLAMILAVLSALLAASVAVSDVPEMLLDIPTTANGNLSLLSPGMELLASIKGPVAIVGMVGPYRSGKSFLLNQLKRVSVQEESETNEALSISSQGDAFMVGDTVWPATAGLAIQVLGKTDDGVTVCLLGASFSTFIPPVS